MHTLCTMSDDKIVLKSVFFGRPIMVKNGLRAKLINQPYHQFQHKTKHII